MKRKERPTETKKKKRKVVRIRRKSKSDDDKQALQRDTGRRGRKNARGKKNGRRRMIVFWFLTICVAVIIGAFALLRTPFFSIKAIEYEGQKNLTQEQIVKIAGVKVGENIFATNVGAAEKRLEDNPEIMEARITRVFPNKLKISVTEERPLAYAEFEKQFLLINSDGKIIKVLKNDAADSVKTLAKAEGFGVVSQKPGELIAAADDARAGELFKCIGLLDELQMTGKVNYVNFGDLSDLKIEYENRLYMLMGSFENLDYKLKFVQKVINEQISAYERALLDFRGEKLYVRPRDEEQPAAAEENSAEKQPAEGQQGSTESGQETTTQPVEQNHQGEDANKPNENQTAETPAE